MSALASTAVGAIVLASAISVQLPDGLTERPIDLAKDAGTYTAQGQAYLIGYHWIDAARSFHAALRKEEDAGRAHVGLAYAYHHLGDHARETAELAKAKDSDWVKVARLQLRAIHTPVKQQGPEHAAYKRALDELIAKNPKDADLHVWRGMAEEPGPWGRGQNGGREALRHYNRALKLDPSNLGALHYGAHTLENLGHHQRASELAKQYAERSPHIPHAHHMYAHTLPRLGRWEDAYSTLIKADTLHRAWFKKLGVKPEVDWHYGHNLMVLAVVELRLGKTKDAETHLKTAFDLDMQGVYEALYNGPWLNYLLWKGEDDQALAAARKSLTHPSPAVRLVGACASGEALLGLGMTSEALRMRDRANEADQAFRAALADDWFAIFGPYFAGERLTVLNGMIALRGEPEQKSAGKATLLQLGDGISQAQTIDAWAQGLYLLDRLAKDADSLGDKELAKSFRRRAAVIDAKFYD